MMPVAAPNDRDISTELLAPRLPILGNIKIGGKRPASTTSGKGKEFQPPVKYDHFLITTLERGADNNFIRNEEIHRRLGTPKPTELDVRLPFESVEDNFYAQMVQYSGRSRTVQCDGENALDLSTEVASVCERRQGKECSCKPYGRLSVILEAAPTFGGIYVFRTTSWGTTAALQTELRIFHEQFGSLWGLPLRMRLYPAPVKYMQGGKERTGTAYRVAILLRASFQEAAAAAIEFRRAGALARREALQLAPGTTEALQEIDAGEAPEIEAEWFPDEARESHRADHEGRSRLAEINEGIAADRSAEPDLDLLSTDLEVLLEEFGERLAKDAKSGIAAAIEARNPEKMANAHQWLMGRLTQPHDRLVAHRLLARARLLLSHDDEEAINQALAADDEPRLISWSQDLEARIQARDPSAATTED